MSGMKMNEIEGRDKWLRGGYR